MEKTKFYEFKQNNSGGYFDVDENVCNRVIIEANSSEQAQSIFEPMIYNQSASCPCCGDRWSSYDPDEIDLEKHSKNGWVVKVYDHSKNPEQEWQRKYGKMKIIEEPKWVTEYGFKQYKGKIAFSTIEEYSEFMAGEYGWTTPDCIIHYLDGRKHQINKKRW